MTLLSYLSQAIVTWIEKWFRCAKNTGEYAWEQKVPFLASEDGQCHSRQTAGLCWARPIAQRDLQSVKSRWIPNLFSHCWWKTSSWASRLSLLILTVHSCCKNKIKPLVQERINSFSKAVSWPLAWSSSMPKLGLLNSCGIWRETVWIKIVQEWKIACCKLS